MFLYEKHVVSQGFLILGIYFTDFKMPGAGLQNASQIVISI